MNINFIDELKVLNNIVNLDFYYLSDFKRGNFYQPYSYDDFISFFGDYNLKSHRIVKELLSQGITLNIDRCINPTTISTDITSDSTRSAHQFVSLFKEDTIRQIYNQTITLNTVETEGVMNQLYLNDKQILVEKKSSTWSDTTDGIDSFTWNDTKVETQSNLKFNNSDRIKKITFKYDKSITGNYTFLDIIGLNGIIGLDETGYNYFKIQINGSGSLGITISGKVNNNDSYTIIYNNMSLTQIETKNLYKIEIPSDNLNPSNINPFNLRGYISYDISNSLSDVTFSIEKKYIILDNTNFSNTEVKTTSPNTFFTQPFYSNSNDYYIYDYMDESFNDRLYQTITSKQPDSQPIIAVFSKTTGLHGNSIKVEIKGNNHINSYDTINNGVGILTDEDVLINVYYEDNIVETFITSTFNIQSNYINLIYSSNNENMLIQDVNLLFNLQYGNDGVLTLDSWKNSFKRHFNDFSIILLDFYDNVDNIQVYNEVVGLYPNSIILTPTLHNKESLYFYNKIKHESNIFVFDGSVIADDFVFPKYMLILYEINNILNGNYKRLKNIYTSSNYINVNKNNNINKLINYNINYFNDNQLQTEVSILNSLSLGKTIITNKIKTQLSRLLDDFVFSLSDDTQTITKVINDYIKTLDNITVTFELKSQTNYTLTYNFKISFPSDVDSITFNLIKLISQPLF